MLGEYVYKRKAIRVLIGIFDLIGYAFIKPVLLLLRNSSKKNSEPYKKILLIRLDHVGDGLFLLPSLQAARNLFPNAHITLLAGPWASSFVQPGQWVDEVKMVQAPWFARPIPRSFDWKFFWGIVRWIKEQKFEVGIDFRGDLRHIFWMAFSRIPVRVGYGCTGAGFLLSHENQINPSRHEVERNLDLLRFFQPNLQAGPLEIKALTEKSCLTVDDLLRQSGIQGETQPVVFQVTAGYPSKEWAPEKFAELMDAIGKRPGLRLVVIGAGEDAIKVEKILSRVKSQVLNLCGKTNLEELAALFQRSKAYVGLDSGPAHLAVAMGTRCVLIYSGVNDLARWGPWTLERENRVKVLHRPVECSPCTLPVCNRKHECLDPIQPEDVLRELIPWLDK